MAVCARLPLLLAAGRAGPARARRRGPRLAVAAGSCGRTLFTPGRRRPAGPRPYRAAGAAGGRWLVGCARGGEAAFGQLRFRAAPVLVGADVCPTTAGAVGSWAIKRPACAVLQDQHRGGGPDSGAAGPTRPWAWCLHVFRTAAVRHFGADPWRAEALAFLASLWSFPAVDGNDG
jgi:hypothetical protein